MTGLLVAALAAATVTHYSAALDVRIAAGTIGGHVVLTANAAAVDADRVVLDAGDIAIDAVTIGRRPVTFTKSGTRLVIELPATLRHGHSARIDATYHVEPKRGVRFVKDAGQAYTIFSTSQWLPCIDAPDQKATLDLSIRFDTPVIAVGSGDDVDRGAASRARTTYRWVTRRPVSTYVFGFAAGRYAVASDSRAGVRLTYLGTTVTVDELRSIFRDTGDMIEFFAEKAGTPYPSRTYTQVLATGSVEQEVEEFTLLSESYGRGLLTDPTDEWLQAHELAHQWWGNGVTCASWNEFWLNEAFATFMADAWKERRFGRAMYLHEIDLSRTRYERVRDAGHDHPLVYESWDHPTAADRTIVYQKGAYVLHLLREQLGDEPFWRGIRDYTRQYMNRSVTTTDFQQAMERSTGVDLSAFFARWVAHPASERQLFGSERRRD